MTSPNEHKAIDPARSEAVATQHDQAPVKQRTAALATSPNDGSHPAWPNATSNSTVDAATLAAVVLGYGKPAGMNQSLGGGFPPLSPQYGYQQAATGAHQTASQQAAASFIQQSLLQRALIQQQQHLQAMLAQQSPSLQHPLYNNPTIAARLMQLLQHQPPLSSLLEQQDPFTELPQLPQSRFETDGRHLETWRGAAGIEQRFDNTGNLGTPPDLAVAWGYAIPSSAVGMQGLSSPAVDIAALRPSLSKSGSSSLPLAAFVSSAAQWAQPTATAVRVDSAALQILPSASSKRMGAPAASNLEEAKLMQIRSIALGEHTLQTAVQSKKPPAKPYARSHANKKDDTRGQAGESRGTIGQLKHPTEEELQKEFRYTFAGSGSIPDVSIGRSETSKQSDRPFVASQVFVRSKVRSLKGIERRERKNASARSQAAVKRALVERLSKKNTITLSSEEKVTLEATQEAMSRKNRRSHESHMAKKAEIERILRIPEPERTNIQANFLEQMLYAKKRKNEGDRLRRKRLKELGFQPSINTGKIGLPSRGPIPMAFAASTTTSSSNDKNESISTAAGEERAAAGGVPVAIGFRAKKSPPPPPPPPSDDS